MMRRHRSSAGFTLLEMIMVIVITGIIAGMVAVFITKPVQGYVDSVRRAELTDAADVAMRRMTRDVRLALPNSLRPVTNGFEFIMTKGGGKYRADGDGSSGPGISILSFTDNTKKSFDILGSPPSFGVGDFIFVYNLGTEPADAYKYNGVTNICGSSKGCNVVKTTNTASAVTFDTNHFAGQSPPLPSPDSRFQVVGLTEKVVRYVCPVAPASGELTRQQGCDFADTATGCSTAARLAGSPSSETGIKASCVIDYLSSATGRNGLLYIQLTLTQSGESVTLFQQIHVDNSP